MFKAQNLSHEYIYIYKKKKTLHERHLKCSSNFLGEKAYSLYMSKDRTLS